VVLLITLVILVILSTLGYTLGTRVAAHRHRDRYVIDYAQAQYACASGMKYALASLNDLAPEVISRPNEPDFSDVFALTEPQYQQLLTQMVENVERAQNQRRAESKQRARRSSDTLDDAYAGDLPSAKPGASAGVPGPYGPRWPLVVEPVELEIGSVVVTVEIEDENAKYPLGWTLMTGQATAPPAPGARVTVEERNRAAEADVGFRTFCEWMGYRPEEVTSLKEDLAKVSAIRPFKMEFKPVAAPAAALTSADSLRSRVSQTRTTAAATAAAARATTGRSVISAADQMDRQNADLARLFHSSLIDTDLLTRPTVVSESRKESALKYLGLWATRQVNVNTAPRHVLEAALAFGSVADAPKIADAIIQRRKVQPFSDVEELKRDMMRYSDAIEKSREFITTNSTVFTVKVTAVSGVARKVALAGVTKEGPKVKTIAVISD
jgi:hypothetical protein